MSLFITQADYLPTIKNDNLMDLIGQDESILDVVENEAMSEIESALSERYDTAAMFAQVGDDRQAYVIKLCRYLILYELYKRAPHLAIPEHIKEDNAFARAELKFITKGDKSLAGAPRKLENEQAITNRIVDSENPRR